MGKGLSKDHKKLVVKGKNGNTLLQEDSTQAFLEQSAVPLQSVTLRKALISAIPQPILQCLQSNPSIHNTLTQLNLSGNELTEVPEAFSYCLSLEVLNLADNKLVSFPGCITANLYRLKVLNLAHNKLKELPWEWSNMVALEDFDISHNNLSYIPVTLGGLALTSLGYTGNPLGREYKEFYDLDSALKYIGSQFIVPAEYAPQKRDLRLLRKKEEALLDFTKSIKEFRKFMSKEKAVMELLEFMQSEYSSENLLFILTVLKFKARFPSIHPIHHPELTTAAFAIYNRFVSSDSPQMVNLPADITEELLDIFSTTNSEKLTQYVFDKALEKTIIGTGSDPFQRFLKTAAGQKWNVAKMEAEKDTRYITGFAVPRWVPRSNWDRVEYGPTLASSHCN